VARRGAVRRSELDRLGVDSTTIGAVRVEGDWLVDPDQWSAWADGLRNVVTAYEQAQPLEPGMPAEAARQATGLPDLRLLGPIAAAAGLEQVAGRVRRPGSTPELGGNVDTLTERLAEDTFAAPEQPELDALGLGRREIAAAVAAGRLLRLDGPDATAVVLLPDAPAQAMRLLSALPQPFTASAARQAMGTTRRVAIPLLEHLDERGWTRRLDGSLREVVR
jgi:selenocysteine-specific elongation factor